MYESDFDGLTAAMICFSMITAIAAAVIYFLGSWVYESQVGGLAILLLCTVYGLFLVVAAIPYIGFIIQIYATLTVAWNTVSEFTGLYSTWLTTLIFVAYAFSGLIFTYRSSKFVHYRR